MLTLLVPVDGSKNSLRAVKYAAAQSKHCPVTLHILNVEPPLDDYGMVRAYGDAPAVIADLGRRLKCDAIVMGTRGMTTLGSLVPESVASKVVHMAKVPVTLVK